MAWEYGMEGDDPIRTCDICHLTQIKCKDGEWAIYITMKRIARCFDCIFLDIDEKCCHTPEEDSE